jgi:hypothetical protein
MRSIHTFSIALLFSIVLMLGLVGCVIGQKQQAKIVTPPPPPPPKPAEPPPRPEPLSIPQTQTQLPQQQPISPEALATLQPPPQTPEETQPNPGTTSRSGRRVGPVVGPKPESAVGPAAVAGQSIVAAPPIVTPVVPPPSDTEPRATVQEIVPPAELKRLQETVPPHQQELHKILDAALARHLTREQQALAQRILSFLQQSEDAVKRNDWRQANTLAERAQVLAKELTGGDQ